MSNVAATLDEIGRPAWIALMVLSFIVYWPLGLAMLAFLIWSGRMMGCRHHRGAGPGPGRWWQDAEGAARRWTGGGYARSSGNWAFDEYRAEALRRLEEEQPEFRELLERLRHATDKAELDQCRPDRGRRNGGPTGLAA